VIADALAEQGAHIALAARSEEGLRAVAQALSKHGVQTIIVPVDLSRSDQQQKLVSTVLEKFGTIDILINNAGLESEGAFLELPWDTIETTINVNLVAPMALTYHVLPHMLKQKSGHIVNIASVGAKSGIAYSATYCGTKAGLAEWTRGMRLELEGSGIHFTAIFPGYVTEVGMFAKFHLTPPSLVGCCTPSQVAKGVVRAIEKEKLEVIINSGPIKLASVLSELSPKMGDWLVKTSGAVAFQKKKVGK